MQPHQWATYWLNGNVPLAALLRAGNQTHLLDHDLPTMVDQALHVILSGQRSDGQLGPDTCGWQFGTMNAIRSLVMWADTASPTLRATIDDAVFRSLAFLLTNCTLQDRTHGGPRWPSHLEAILAYLDAFPPTTTNNTPAAGTEARAATQLKQTATATATATADPTSTETTPTATTTQTSTETTETTTTSTARTHTATNTSTVPQAPTQAANRLRTLLDLSASWHATGLNWREYYLARGGKGFPTPFPLGPAVPAVQGANFHHGVNTAEGLKFAGVEWRLWALDPSPLGVALDLLDRYHQHPQTTWGADEFLAGRDPRRGTELCDIVESMYSLGWHFQQTNVTSATLALLDRVEALAFNALPGTVTADMWMHQYDQQTNGLAAAPGVECGGLNGPQATVFGLQPYFPCCAVNLPQGWPKLAMHAVQTRLGDGAILLAHLVPVAARIGSVVINVSTAYPFDDVVEVEASNRDPHAAASLLVRIPGWASNLTATLNGRPVVPAPRNGTLWKLLLAPANVPVAAVLTFHPEVRFDAGWGSPAPAPVSYSAGGRPVPVPSHRTDDFVCRDGGSLIPGVRGQIRSGNPGQVTLAVVHHPLESHGHELASVSVQLQYVAGYTPAPGDPPRRGSRVDLVVVDALDTTRVLATLWQSGTLDAYSADNFTQWSPPITATTSNLSFAYGASFFLALRFSNNQRNLVLRTDTLNLTVSWGPAATGRPWAKTRLDTNAVRVVRGPLVYALPLNESSRVLSKPAAGGQCEVANHSGCQSRDVAFYSGVGDRWNFALAPHLGARFVRTNGKGRGPGERKPQQQPQPQRLPFDGRAPRFYIVVEGVRIASWGLADAFNPTSPPPSPVATNKSQGLVYEAVRLVPFGVTNIRISCFPWIDKGTT
eukprot:m.265966 g.265966  ORF g.265966 m.265966 type:complete len:888 (-) comp19268_c0_seq1:129-2792(-)